MVFLETEPVLSGHRRNQSNIFWSGVERALFVCVIKELRACKHWLGLRMRYGVARSGSYPCRKGALATVCTG